jgi:hypothetical protein
MPTIEEVLAAQAGKRGAKPQAEGKVNVYGLGILWKQGMAEHTGEFARPLSGKEQGQIKHLMRKTPGHTVQVIDGAVRDWSGFTGRVISLGLAKTAPKLLNLDFLLLHSDVAVQLIAQLPHWPEPTVAESLEQAATKAQAEAAAMHAPAAAALPAHVPMDKEAQMKALGMLP